MIDPSPATLAAAIADACAVSGGVIKWGQACRQFDTPADLDVFRRELSGRGLLTGEAMEAIEDRARQLGRGR